MNREQVLIRLKEQLPTLRRTYGVARLGIFGSFAKGAPAGDSDVDLVVELERPLGLQFVEMAESIERILGRRVDILTPKGIAAIRNQKIAKSIEKSVIYV